MYVPESKSIQAIGWGPYRKAMSHWAKAAYHWVAYNVVDLASKTPFFDKELCFVKEVGELVLAIGNLYATAVIIADQDTVLELRDAYNEILSMWNMCRKTYS